MRLLLVTLLGIVSVLAACRGDEGEPTRSVCPSDSTLTYANFGRSLFERYCYRCHTRDLVGTDRSGSPLGSDYDSLTAIRAQREELDHHAAAGPNAVNEHMPPDGVRPSLDERRRLGEWLACGAP